MKTIFITSFNPFISRNILATDVFKILRSVPDLKIVIFIPDYKVDYFHQRYAGPNVIIEGVAAEKISRQDVFFNFLGSSLVDSKTISIHKREILARDNNYLKFFLSFVLRKIFSPLSFFKKAARAVDYLTIDTKTQAKFFDRYRPDLIFATDVFNNDDVHFLAMAKRRGISTIGMIRSWDNISTKGMFRIRPGKLIVNNEVIKNAVTRHNEIDANNIFVSGIPQYDRYLKGKRISRDEFFRKIGLDPNKKLILYSPFGGRFYKYDWQIMEILKEFGEQVLVRLTPNDKVPLDEFKPSSLFYIDQPGYQFHPNYFRDVELDERDANWLADSLYHSDVVVSGGASIAIDAAVFEKPSVLIYFDGFEKNLPYLQSAKRWLEHDHAKKVWQSGSVKAAKSKEELLDAVRQYLKNPKLNEAERRSMLMEQCWKLDGNSGKRIADFLINYLK